MFDESPEELFEQAPVGYLSTRIDGTIVRVNETFIAWTRYSRDKLLAGTRFPELLSVPGRIYYETHIAPLLQMQRFVREIALDLVRADGSTLHVLMNAARKQLPGQAGEIVRVTIFDATERWRFEQELLKAKRLAEQSTRTERSARKLVEQASRIKDDFLAMVSHDLRTPLSAILGWTHVLRQQTAGNADAAHGLNVIERNTQVQVQLVDDLLDMARIISGKLRLDVQRVDLATTIEHAIETTRLAAEARHIRIQSILDPSVSVVGDPGRLQQVFWNLLTNAVKFTPKNGFIRIVMALINSHIEVSVTDSGQGMTPEFLAQAFERFRQSDSVEAGTQMGLGLGLSIVKHLVEMHGGSIEAHSEGLGRGSTFTLHLPLAAVQNPADEANTYPRMAMSVIAKEAVSIRLDGVKVVVADDEPDARELVRRLLWQIGADVVTAESTAAALEAIQRTQPHVLVSDIGMPGGDGYELIRQVRLLGGDVGRVAAIALTAFSRLEDRTRTRLAGYQVHLSKPVDPHELIIAVASLAGRAPLVK
ncbi:MAG: ATP-binding protein [Gammaproteobacteria bacterium]